MRMTDGGLRKIWRERIIGADWHWQSIEVGAVGKGVPDINYCALVPRSMSYVGKEKEAEMVIMDTSYGQEGWIENKWTDGWVVGLEPEQVAWILRRCRSGGLVTVAVRRRCEAGLRRARADEIYLFRGTHARVVRDAGLRPFSLAIDGSPPGISTVHGVDLNGALLHRFEGGPARWDWLKIRAALLRRPDPWRDEYEAG